MSSCSNSEDTIILGLANKALSSLSRIVYIRNRVMRIFTFLNRFKTLKPVALVDITCRDFSDLLTTLMSIDRVPFQYVRSLVAVVGSSSVYEGGVFFSSRIGFVLAPIRSVGSRICSLAHLYTCHVYTTLDTLNILYTLYIPIANAYTMHDTLHHTMLHVHG
jgi:hypothetical protein